MLMGDFANRPLISKNQGVLRTDPVTPKQDIPADNLTAAKSLQTFTGILDIIGSMAATSRPEHSLKDELANQRWQLGLN